MQEANDRRALRNNRTLTAKICCNADLGITVMRIILAVMSIATKGKKRRQLGCKLNVINQGYMMKNSIILATCFGAFFSLSVSAFQEDKAKDFISLLETEAKTGNPVATFHLGNAYMDGIGGVQKDLTKGFNYLLESAKQGYPLAQYNVAASYKTGEGTPQNAEQSLYWYLQAAKNGHAPSQLQAALILVEKGDHKKAFELLKLASMKGEVDAQYMLGHMYYAGTAEPQDYRLAYIWFSIAAANGDADAPKARDHIAKMLDAQSLANAQSEAAQIFDITRQNTSGQP